MGAPRRGKRAPEAEQVAVVKVEVPVLVDSTGQAWALPACRALTGAGLAPGSLIESPALDAAAAEVAAQAAREVALRRAVPAATTSPWPSPWIRPPRPPRTTSPPARPWVGGPWPRSCSPST